MEHSTNISNYAIPLLRNTTISTLHSASTFWILTRIFSFAILFVALYLAYRVYRYAYPYCLLSFKGSNGKIFYGFCVCCSFTFLITTAYNNILSIVAWKIPSFCLNGVKVSLVLYSVSLEVTYASFWFQQNYFFKHYLIRLELNHYVVNAIRQLVMFLLALLFPLYFFAVQFGDFQVHDACLEQVKEHGWNSLFAVFTIYRLCLFHAIFGLFIPTYQKLKRKLAQYLGSTIEDTEGAKIYCRETAAPSFRNKLKKTKKLIKRQRRALKIWFMIVLVDLFMFIGVFIKWLEYSRFHLEMGVQLHMLANTVAVVLFVDEWKRVIFPTKRKTFTSDLKRRNFLTSDENEYEEQPTDKTAASLPVSFKGSFVTMPNDNSDLIKECRSDRERRWISSSSFSRQLKYSRFDREPLAPVDSPRNLSSLTTLC